MRFFRLNTKKIEEAERAAKKRAKKNVAKRTISDPRKPLDEGTKLEGYTLGKVIGRGSFSLVYQATELATGQDVVVKEYYPKHFARRIEDGTVMPMDGKKLFTFSEGFKQFFNEAMALNKISHPNVLKTSNMLRANKTAYLISKNKGGRDLKWFLSSTSEGLDQELIYKVFMPILSALNFLHAAELLHLDIKPANILLQPNSESLLLDFGAAQSVSSSKRINRMQTLTHGFAPPEQYDKNRQLGPWTDLYAVAATMYFCIACRPPPKSKDSDTPAQLSVEKYGKDYNYAVIDAINRCLSFDAEKRYDNVDDFATALLDGTEWESLRQYELEAMHYDRYNVETTRSQSALLSAVA